MRQASTPVLWTANGHYYDAVAFPSGITWDDARTYAETLTYNGFNGHLATITSAEENAFIFNTFKDSAYNIFFLGGFQPKGSAEPDGGWQWITGETWSYTNWSPGEPNNTYSGGGIFAPPGTVSEEVLELYGGIGVWNDVPLLSGWGALLVEYDEYETIPDPFPPPGPVLWTANGHYYEAKAFPSGITWDAAKTYAETLTHEGLKGHLATISSAEENAFIVDNFGASTANGYFLGGFQPNGSLEPGGNWQWITGEAWSYTNWHYTAPNDEYSGGAIIHPPGTWGPEEVLHLWANNGTWNDVPHNSGWGGLIIEYDEYETIPVTWPEPEPALWTENGHYYDVKPFPEGITWDDAKAYAETLSYNGWTGHLATITSMEENAFIVDTFGASAVNRYFLGGFQPEGSSEPDGNWQWITGEIWSYINWKPGEPNNTYSGGAIFAPPGTVSEEVLHFYGGLGQWNDVPRLSGWGGLVVEYEPQQAYSFYGFEQPVENQPTVNYAKAGSVIPVKWMITDANGTPISDTSSFESLTSYSIACDTFAGEPGDELEEYSAGESGLQYLGDGHWQFNWKTAKGFVGKCRIMVLKLADGSEHKAYFSFK